MLGHNTRAVKRAYILLARSERLHDCSGPRPTVPIDTPEAPQALQLLPGP